MRAIHGLSIQVRHHWGMAKQTKDLNMVRSYTNLKVGV
jgi:hypothetical protein